MKFKKILSALIFFLLLIIISGCDKGIEPAGEAAPGETGFSGKVTFTGTWPPGVTRTHLFVFKNSINTGDDFSFLNLSAVIDPIPYDTTEFSYNSATMNFIEHNYSINFKIAPGEHAYVIVAQSKTQEISFARADWTIVGVYNIGGDQSKPKTLVIEKGKMTTGVDITVNFGNPPPQPPI
jgi:hypothetical protein